LKRFYTIFCAITGYIRVRKISEKIRNSNRAFREFLGAEGVRGNFPPTSNFLQVSAWGKIEKVKPVREHRQCLLFFSGKVSAFPVPERNLLIFLEE